MYESNEKTVKRREAFDFVYFSLNIFYDPGRGTIDGPLFSIHLTFVFLVVDLKLGLQHFYLRGIFIGSFFKERVNVVIINFDWKSVFRKGIVIYLDFFNRWQADQGKCKRKWQVFRAFLLFCTNFVLINCEFSEFSARVEGHKNLRWLTISKEKEIGTLRGTIHFICYLWSS